MSKHLFEKSIGNTITKSDTENGTFEGVLIKGSVIDSYGDYFSEEAINNFKTKNNSNTIFLLHQHNKSAEIGTMEIYAENGDLKFKAKLDLSKDDNGNFINKEAAKVYSLMKQGAQYDMSVGGRFLKAEFGYIDTDKGQTTAYIIKEFEAWEGSTVIQGSVPGSTVESFKNFNENKEGNMPMDMTKQFEDYKEEVQKIINGLQEGIKKEDVSEEIKKSVETMTADFQKKIDEYNEAFVKKIDDKLNEFSREYAGIQEAKKELTEADLEKSIWEFMRETNSDKGYTVKSFSQFLEKREEEMAKSTGTSAVPQAILPLLSRTILRRAQDTKNIWAYVSKFSMSEMSTKIPRELIGTTEVKFIGETATRAETAISLLDQVELELHQIYALPIFTNKMLAGDVVGFVALVLERVAENFVKKISEKILFGSGTGEPFGILTNAQVTANALTFAATGKVDYDTIIDAKYDLKEDYVSKAVIIMNRKTAKEFFKLKDNNGNPIFEEAYKNGKQDSLSALPVVYDDTLPAFKSANVGDVVVLVADMSRYLGVTHTDYNIRIKDDITQKGFTGYYFETMVGGNVLLPEAFVPVKKK